MTDHGHRWKRDPAKWDACGRLELLGACIGPINESSEHVEIRERRNGTPIEDSDIPGIVSDINTLADATTLDLSETNISDLAADHLAQLETVTNLYLGSTNLTDVGICRLTEIPTLRNLVLSGTAITDTGLAKLAAAKELRFLQLYETQVTDVGVSRLLHANPHLKIER